MKDYLLHRYKQYLGIALGLGIGIFAAILFSDMSVSYISFIWIALGLLVGESIYFFYWFHNIKKDEN